MAINSRAPLDRSPKKNWVENSGGLPMYIRRIANHLHQEKGKTIGHSIAIAVNAVKKMCASGDVNFPGKQQVNAGSQAEACAAVRSWEKKKAEARVSKGDLGHKWSDAQFIEFLTGENVEEEIHKGCGCEHEGDDTQRKTHRRRKKTISKQGYKPSQPRDPSTGKWWIPGKGGKQEETTVKKMKNGKWGVFRNGKLVKGGFATKSAALAWSVKKDVNDKIKNAEKDLKRKEAEKNKGKGGSGSGSGSSGGRGSSEGSGRGSSGESRGSSSDSGKTEPPKKMTEFQKKKFAFLNQNGIPKARARNLALGNVTPTKKEKEVLKKWRLQHRKNKSRPGILAGGGVPWLTIGKTEFEELSKSLDAEINADADGRIEFNITGPIEKADADKQLVFGWCSVAKKADGTVVVDKQGDVLEDIDQMENVAYDFVLHSRDGGEMHVRKGVSTLVESFVSTPEKWKALGIPEGTLPVGWWVGFKVTDSEVWKAVKEGRYRMFSVHGSGLRKAMDE